MEPGTTILITGANNKKRENQLREILTKIFPKAPKFNPNLVKMEGFIGIDQVRSFKANLSQKPYSGNIQVGLITVEDITLEAQNALLKLVEEPQNSVQIIISVKSENKLIPTIVSRCQKIFTSDELTKNSVSDKTKSQAEKISQANIGAKFEIAAKLQTKEAISWSCEQIIFWRQVFLVQLGVIPNQSPDISKLAKKQDLEKTAKILKGLIQALALLKLNVNPKLLLENLFLSLD